MIRCIIQSIVTLSVINWRLNMVFKQIKIKYKSEDYTNVCISLLNKIVTLNELLEKFSDKRLEKKLIIYKRIYQELVECCKQDIILYRDKPETLLIYGCLVDKLTTIIEKIIFDDKLNDFDKHFINRYIINSLINTMNKFKIKYVDLSKGGEKLE